MKLALALLLFAAPLTAQTSTDQKIVFNVVVTLVRTGGPSITPPPAPNPPPVVAPPPTPNPDPTPTPDPTPPPPPGTGCIDGYPDAANSINDVSTDLLALQTLYSTALSQNLISAATYNAGSNTLAIVRSDTGDLRDLIRIAGPSDVIAQNVTFVSAEVATLPGLLGTNAQLKGSMDPIAASMQKSLGVAGALVAGSTCPQTSP